MGQCYGTCRYAVRCRRTARPGEDTCGLHKHQDVTWRHENDPPPPPAPR